MTDAELDDRLAELLTRYGVMTAPQLERARALGFRSVEFIDRGPGGNYLFALSKTDPLPKCAAYNRLCL